MHHEVCLLVLGGGVKSKFGVSLRLEITFTISVFLAKVKHYLEVEIVFLLEPLVNLRDNVKEIFRKLTFSLKEKNEEIFCLLLEDFFEGFGTCEHQMVYFWFPVAGLDEALESENGENERNSREHRYY